MNGRQIESDKNAPTAEKPSATPPKPAHPDDVAVKPEHPGNIPAGTPGNPVEWGEPYEVNEDIERKRVSDAEKRRQENPERRGDQTKPS